MRRVGVASLRSNRRIIRVERVHDSIQPKVSSPSLSKETFLHIVHFNVITLIAYQHLSRDVIKCMYTLDTWTRKLVSLGVPLRLLLFSYRRFAALSLLINAPQKSKHSELSSLCNSRTVETPCDVFEPDFCLNLNLPSPYTLSRNVLSIIRRWASFASDTN